MWIRRPYENPSPPVQCCGGSKMDFPRTWVPGSQASPSLRESRRDGEVRFGWNAAYQVLAQRPRCPWVLAQTLPDSYPLQLSRFLLLGPAALPQPSRCPLPQPPPPPLLLGWVGRAAAWGSRGLYLACGGRAVGAEARRSSWSQS